jgi:hypothetical protein
MYIHMYVIAMYVCMYVIIHEGNWIVSYDVLVPFDMRYSLHTYSLCIEHLSMQ